MFLELIKLNILFNILYLFYIYGEHALAERMCQKWFARFKSGDFGLEYEERPGQPKKFKDEELKALLDEDYCQTQK